MSAWIGGREENMSEPDNPSASRTSHLAPVGCWDQTATSLNAATVYGQGFIAVHARYVQPPSLKCTVV